MNKNQTKAWEHLTTLEKSVLSLVIGSDKTKQEASIILNIYPYKFTEIYNRARKLFLTFTDYYNRYEELIPSIITDDSVSLFITMVVLNRRKPAELVAVVPEFQDWARPGATTKVWEEVLLTIQMDPWDHSQDFYRLLKVFDQWNNFRILPPEYREPSPFPRRRNREFKKIHEQMNTISELGWGMIHKKFGKKTPPYAYIPVPDDFNLSQYLEVRLSKHTLSYCTRNKLPLFESVELASQFAEMSYDFYGLKRVSTYSAQKFWASFRLRIQKAYNYNELLKIKPGDLREFSYRDKQFLTKASTEMTITKSKSTKPTKDSAFW